jgi:hypothetical protein
MALVVLEGLSSSGEEVEYVNSKQKKGQTDGQTDNKRTTDNRLSEKLT